MTVARKAPAGRRSGEVKRLKEAEDTLNAIRGGQVDGLLVTTAGGDDGVVTLAGCEHPYRVMVEEMREGAVTLVNGGTIAYSNPRFAAMVGRPAGEVLGMDIERFVAPAHLAEFRAFLKAAAADGGKAESCLLGPKGEKVATYLTVSPMKETGALCLLAMDISRMKAAEERIKSSLREKELLLREVYHRVKNNLQVISSLFRLQAGGDEKLRHALRASQARVHAMALVHQKLCQSEDLSRIELKDYMGQLIRDLFQSHAMDPERVRWETDVCDASFGLDTAVPLGLIANELVSNALKYAFPDGRAGRIRLALERKHGGMLCLRVEDDGVGMREAPPMNEEEPTSLGLWIVRTLAAQVMGTVRTGGGPGAAISVTFPEPVHLSALP